MGFSKVINPLIAKFPGVYIPAALKQPQDPIPQQSEPIKAYDNAPDPWEDEDRAFFYTESTSVRFITSYLFKLTELILLSASESNRPRRKRKSKPV